MGEKMSMSDLVIGANKRAGAGDEFASHDPATGDVVWQGASANEADVQEAVAAARAAFPDWSRRPHDERIDVVTKYQDVVKKRADEIAQLISRETGKALWETKGEAAALASKVDISLDGYAERTGARASDTAFGRAALRHAAHGVMAVFGPYNFPAHLPNGHIVPALIAGDTVVFKPSEITPGIGAVLADCWREAGLPDGVVNLVQGARETGAALLDAEIDGVLFTGSVDTGVMIHRKFAGRPDIILALEMGGNNPLVVLEDCDAEAAASIVLHSAFVTTGQRCTCARRLMIPAGGHGDAVLEALCGLLDRIRIGAWNDSDEPFMGPLVGEPAAKRVLEAQDRIVAAGAKILRASEQLERGPAFLTPGVLDATGLSQPDAEVFGPLLTVYRVEGFEQAIAAANDTKFGLAAGLVSDDESNWTRFVSQIRAGIVNWNRATTGAASNMPFGGPGFSGNHRPSAYYAADYCAYPVASQEAARAQTLPTIGLRDA